MFCLFSWIKLCIPIPRILIFDVQPYFDPARRIMKKWVGSPDPIPLSILIVAKTSRKHMKLIPVENTHSRKTPILEKNQIHLNRLWHNSKWTELGFLSSYTLYTKSLYLKFNTLQQNVILGSQTNSNKIMKLKIYRIHKTCIFLLLAY